jgi:hypothetical protein
MFVERVLFGSVMRTMSEAEKAEYRRPFLNREDRWPTLSWPRQLPIAGEPPDIVALVGRYGKWMSETDIPKLFINAHPGALLTGQVRNFCRTKIRPRRQFKVGTLFRKTPALKSDVSSGLGFRRSRSVDLCFRQSLFTRLTLRRRAAAPCRP